MISIIVATYRPELLKSLEKSIQDTIGVRHEIISIENPGKKGICEIYNIGALRANYPILCFVHEDVVIKTNNWGIIINDIFQSNYNIGLIGIAGSSYKPAIPAHWSFPDADTETTYINIIQHTNEGVRLNYNNPKNEPLSRVACIDGVWFCTLKKVFEECNFDENLLRGFHGYDVDFSLSVYQKYHVMVTFDILIEHYSNGNFDSKWLYDTIKLHKKWEHILPINIDKLSYSKQKFEEKKALNSIYNKVVGSDYRNMDIIIVISRFKIIRLVGFFNIVNKIIRLSINILKKDFKLRNFFLNSF